MDGEFLERPRPWAPGGTTRFMICIGPLSSLFDLTTFALLWYGFGQTDPRCRRCASRAGLLRGCCRRP